MWFTSKTTICTNGGMADTLVLGANALAYEFESHFVHHTRYVSTNDFKSYVFRILISECLKEPVIEDADTVNSMVQAYTE